MYLNWPRTYCVKGQLITIDAHITGSSQQKTKTSLINLLICKRKEKKRKWIKALDVKLETVKVPEKTMWVTPNRQCSSGRDPPKRRKQQMYMTNIITAINKQKE